MLNKSRLQPILVSRFLLDLRQINPSGDSTQVSRVSQFSNPNFRVPTFQSIVGNLGEYLQHDTHDYETEEAEIDVTDQLIVVTSEDSSAGSMSTRQQREEYGIHEVRTSFIY